jgi:recombination protein RecA
MAKKEKEVKEADNSKIKDAISKLNKQFGAGTVMTFSPDDMVKIERIPSGSMGLDAALGGGWPKGRIIEIYGPESSGKSTITLHAIAEVHKLGGVAAFIDAEHAFDPIYAENLGVEVSNPNKFLFAQPSNGDEAIEIAREFIKSGQVDIIVIDSVAALIPKAELQGDVGDSKMGLHARLMSQAMRMLTGDISKSNTTVIFINQLRDKLNVMWGSPETTTGGNALKFYASVRCDIRRCSQNKEGDVIVSNRARVKIIKNKTAPPFKMCEFNLVFGEGIDRIQEVLEIAVELDIIHKSGSWFSYGDTKLGQGFEGVRSLMKDNDELMKEIESKILKHK